MPKRRGLILAVLLLALSPAARAANHTITVGPGSSFSPETLNIAVGDTVTWENSGAFHDVRADDGSFSRPADSGKWTFSRTFNSAGTVGYHCTIHGLPGVGMFGTIHVGGGGGGEERGALRFSQAAYSVVEGGTVNISVQRVGGDDGPVAVDYSVAAGTATAADFTPETGNLDWANNDDNPKIIPVATTNDSANEGNETILLTLSSPSGGATLGAPSTAILTIQDNDGTPGQTPAPPTGLQGMAHGPSEVMLDWTDASNNETGFVIEARQVGGTFQTVGTVGANTTTATIPGLEPSTFYLFRVRAQGSGGTSAPSNQVGIATLGELGPCVAGPQTLCLNSGRFQAELDWRTGEGSGTGKAVPVPSAPDSGLFYFFSENNLEMLIKVLNACGVNNRYWVFFAATTNVEFAVVVTDTLNGRTAAYFNPLDTPAPPVQDTSAFPSCP